MVSFPDNPPPSPGFNQVQMGVRNVVAETEQKFNLHRQQHDYGTSKWVGSLKLPVMTQDKARDWKAWVTSMRGSRGSFKISDPAYDGPRGDVSQSGTVVSVPNSLYLLGKGFESNVSSLFKRGDQIEVNDRLKIILESIDSTENGKALISVAPRIRNKNIDGDTINISQPNGKFRLGDNVIQWDEETIITRLDFPIMEVT
jgi:hypothetical protein